MESVLAFESVAGPLAPPSLPATGGEGTAPGAGGGGVAVALRGVSKSYGGRSVLRAIELDVEAGRFVAIVGRSGSGKSTLLRLVAGLETADAGVVLTDGAAPSMLGPALRIMFQDARLLPWRRVLDNVVLGLARERRSRAISVLERVGLADRAGDWPAVLSGGQKQRVALARALASDPRLLLLDEPLGALDALTRLDMQRLIESLWIGAGFTALLVTHDVAEACLLADRVILIEDGRIALDVTIDLPRPRRAGAELAVIEARILDRILARDGSAG